MDLLDLTAAEISQKCVDAFERCLPKQAQDAGGRDAKSKKLAIAPAVDERLEYRLADFNLWVDGIGALASGKASLDWRLNTRPIDLTLVKSNLVMLLHAVEDYKSPEEDGKSADEALLDIDSSLSNLASLSLAIRRTGRRSRLHKADRLFNEKDHEELRRHLECIAVLRPQEDGRDEAELHQKMRALTPAQNRLVLANLRRRNRFLQAHRHSRGLKKRELGLSPVPEDQPTAQEEPQPQAASDLPQPKPATPIMSQALPTTVEQMATSPQIKTPGAPTMSGTSASIPESKLRFRDLDSKKSEASTPRTEITQITASARYPKPRISDPNQKIFQCPCCCQTLPIEDVKSNVKWRKHLTEDLCPYTCIIENCPKPDMLYSTRTALEQHVRQDHPPTWQCPLCEDGPIFASMPEMMDHLHKVHPEATEEDGVEGLIANSAQQRMGIDACPLCDEADYVDSPELIDHVLEHIHDFSLRALPWPRAMNVDFGGEVGSFDPDVDDAPQIAKWLFEIQPSDDDRDNAWEANPCRELQFSDQYDSDRLNFLTQESQASRDSPFYIDIFFADEEGDESSRATHQTSESSTSSDTSTGNDDDSLTYDRQYDPQHEFLPPDLYNEVKSRLHLNSPFAGMGAQPMLVVRVAHPHRKTHLGLAICYQARLQYSNLPIYWIDHSTPDTIRRSYRAIAEATSHLPNGTPDISYLPEPEATRAVKQQLEKDDQFLMIIDNVDKSDTLVRSSDLYGPARYNSSGQIPRDCPFPTCDASESEPARLQIHMRTAHSDWAPLENYIPQCPGGSLLVLTTQPSDSAEFDAISNIEQEAEEAEYAINRIFDGHDVTDRTPADLFFAMEKKSIRPKMMIDLSTRLSFDHWAIAVAAAFSEDTSWTLSDILGHMRMTSQKKPRLSGTKLLFQEVIIPELSRSRSALLSWFSALVFLDPTEIPERVVQELNSEPNENNTLEGSVNLTKRGYSYQCYALIFFNGRDKFSVYPVFLEAVLEWLRSRKEVRDHHSTAVQLIAGPYPRDVVSNPKAALEYLPHALRLLDFGIVDVEDRRIRDLVELVRVTLEYYGAWDKAEAVLLKHSQNLIEILGDKDGRSMQYQVYLAKVYNDHHQTGLAKRMAERVVQSLEGVENDRPYLAIAANVALATILIEEGEWILARRCANSAMSISRMLGEEFKCETGLAALLAFADASLGLGKEELGWEALDTVEKHLPHNSSLKDTEDLVFHSFRYRLANVWMKYTKGKKVEILHQQVLDGRLLLMGPNHPATVKSMLAVAQVVADDARYDEAMKLCQTAESIINGQRLPHAASNARIIAVYRLMARIYQGKGDYSSAHETIEMTYGEAKDALTASHPLALAVSEERARIRRLWLRQKGFPSSGSDSSHAELSENESDMLDNVSNTAVWDDALDNVEEPEPAIAPITGLQSRTPPLPSSVHVQSDSFLYVPCSSISIGTWNFVVAPDRVLEVSFSRPLQMVRYTFTSLWGVCKIEYPYLHVATTSIRFPDESERGNFLKIHLRSAPSFYTHDTLTGQFSPCADFTLESQASLQRVHYLEGDMRELSSELGFNSSVYKNPQHLESLTRQQQMETQGTLPEATFILPSQPFGGFAAIARAFDLPPSIPSVPIPPPPTSRPSSEGLPPIGQSSQYSSPIEAETLGRVEVVSRMSQNTTGSQYTDPIPSLSKHVRNREEYQAPWSQPWSRTVVPELSRQETFKRRRSDPPNPSQPAPQNPEPLYPQFPHNAGGSQYTDVDPSLRSAHSHVESRGRSSQRPSSQHTYVEDATTRYTETQYTYTVDRYQSSGAASEYSPRLTRTTLAPPLPQASRDSQSSERLQSYRDKYSPLLPSEEGLSRGAKADYSASILYQEPSSRTVRTAQIDEEGDMNELRGYPPPPPNSGSRSPLRRHVADLSSANLQATTGGPSMSPPKLPPGWIAQWDKSSRRYYFVNFSTGQTQWDLPAGNDPPIQNAVIPGLPEGLSHASQAPPRLPSGWIAQWDIPSRQYYYVNFSTRQTQWELPTEDDPPGQGAAYDQNPLSPPVPSIVTHPDGSQTRILADGTVEPIMPATRERRTVQVEYVAPTTQTQRGADGTVEPIMPATREPLNKFMSDNFGYPARQQPVITRTPEATLPYYRDQISHDTVHTRPDDAGSSSHQPESQGPLATFRKTFSRRKDRTKK